MPNYEYLCEKCEHYFEKIVKIDDMHVPEAEPCPQCAEVAVKKVMFSAPAIGDAVRLRIRRPDGGFREVLHKIHEKNPRSKIKDNSSFI